VFSRLPLRRISFRWQITLLGVIVLFLFAVVLSASFSAFHYSRSSVLKQERDGLREATGRLVSEYSEKEEFAKQHNDNAPLAGPETGSSQVVLNLMARVVLQNYPGMEGGYYSSERNKVEGYFPFSGQEFVETAEGKGQDDLRTAVLQLANQAAVSQRHVSQVLTTDQSIVLLDAAPVPSGPGFQASAWTLKQLPGLPGSNRFIAYLSFAGLSIASLASVMLTLLLVRNLQVGVQKVETALQNLEANLDSQIRTDEEPDEIKRIASAVNRLGATLRQKIESEKVIESRLRHAERLAALGRLVAGVAHEVRNPLATIRLRVQMCQQSTTDLSILESCDVALEEIERLNEMIARLLNFSRPVHLHREPTNLSRLVEQRLEYFRARGLQCGVKLSSNLVSDAQWATVDQGRIAQVFDNVIQNAIEAMSGSGGTLCVNISGSGSNDPSVFIEFNDTGEGIAASELGRIFDPFFTTKQTGTGLGLSICHELVRAHGGEIQVASAKGSGTTVRIILPGGLTESAEALA
jgi:two-component system, NtrC family, sensor histidine kinase HydH